MLDIVRTPQLTALLIIMTVHRTWKVKAVVDQQPIMKDIVIGGAGYAGISIGSELGRRGVENFCILEASDRVGGRMHQAPVGPYMLDDGASFVHGTAVQPSWTQIREFPIDNELVDFDSVLLFDQNGNPVTWGFSCKKINTAMRRAYLFVNKCLHPTKLNKRRRKRCRRTVSSFRKARDDDDMTLRQLLWQVGDWDYRKEPNVAVARMCEYGVVDWELGYRADLLSANNTYPSPPLNEVSNTEKFVTDPRGYVWIVKKLGAKYLETSVETSQDIQFDDPRLNLQHKVTLVKWDPSGNTMVTVEACPTVKQSGTFESPDLFPCDDNAPKHVLVANEFISTFSLGVLKKSIQEEERGATFAESRNVAPRFDPPLTEAIPGVAQSIQDSGMTNVMRVFLQFNTKFWPNELFFFSAVTSPSSESPTESVELVAPLWQNYDIPGMYPGSRILMTMLLDDQVEVFESLSQVEAQTRLLAVISSMFAFGVRQAFGRPNLLPSDLVDMHMTRWGEDPLFRGSWSFPRIGQSEGQAATYGGRYGNLVFSGEASCRRHAATTGGAFEGGKRTARLLLKERYGKKISTRTSCDFRG